jgi:hypothetical protein
LLLPRLYTHSCVNHRVRNLRRGRLGRRGLCGRRFRNFAGRQQTRGFWGRQMARRAGRLGRGLCGRRFRNFAGRRQTQGFWGRQMAWRAGRLGRGRFDAGSQYPGLGLRRLLRQRRFRGLRRRAGLWNQPAYSRNQESESSSPRERVPEKSVPEKHASEAAAIESEKKTESQHKTGRSRKKRHRGD